MDSSLNELTRTDIETIWTLSDHKNVGTTMLCTQFIDHGPLGIIGPHGS
ncbi:hypothetical protein [Sorangium sp. So ce233]